MITAKHSIKGFIFRTAVLFSSLGFLLIYLAATASHRDTLKLNAEINAGKLALNTANELYSLMLAGWPAPAIEHFYAGLNRNPLPSDSASTDFQIRLHRYLEGIEGKQTTPAATNDDLLAYTQVQGKPQSAYKDTELRYLQPMIAEQACLGCHQQASAGQVLGVIEVRQDIAPLLQQGNNRLLFNLMLLSPLPFLLSLLVVHYLHRRIRQSIHTLEENIERIETVSDLKHLKLQTTPQGFTELESIYERVGHLAEKMRNVAVDKDILEEEIHLLEKFVITSEVVQDWRKSITRLAKSVNQLIPTYNLFTLFNTEDGGLSVEIFWAYTPSRQEQEWMEQQLKHRLQQGELNYPDDLLISHHLTHGRRGAIMTVEQMHLHSRTLQLDQPQITGMVGICAHKHLDQDNTRRLVVNGILSTLVNMLGSIKAISKYTEDLEYYATRDPLTNLHNQRIFWEMLDYEIIRAKRLSYPFCVMMIDLDNFKSLNDNFGHSFGDGCLKEVSRTIRKVLRSGDLLARYGGDEFALVLPESDLTQSRQVAERLISQLQRNGLRSPNGSSLNVGLSIGIAVYPDHADNSRDLFMFADNMMYRAKSQGKNRISVPDEQDVLEVFHDMNQKSILISNAIKEKSIIPYFQPLKDTRSGEIAAVEVLCRLKTHQGRILKASEFVEIAERLSLVHTLDFIVLEKALAQVELENYQGQLFINISPCSLLLAEFIPRVNELVDESDVERQRIVFEITERETVKNMALLEQHVNSLKGAGYQLAVDDFGSGFSSFHYLKHFPIDYVKIDGEFVANMVNCPKDHAVVRCISNLAAELKAKTIAEYVESEAVLEAVKTIGIDYAQGYHIRRPTPYILEQRDRLKIISGQRPKS